MPVIGSDSAGAASCRTSASFIAFYAIAIARGENERLHQACNLGRRRVWRRQDGIEPPARIVKIEALFHGTGCGPRVSGRDC